ncbi:site-specific integrase [Bacillus sp. MRMR6]|uniref:tyrosine-type recombinase/integrase n=1 Tax=Bacillus sp. MRMR6 TaxID=1928617 RepID=UPI000952CF53|nr:site-specific integrase [Bacillus sp. MRMR6]OLS39178.1 hypothetical protein BTR25_13695 [Bacillus sp. MRMR6]
MVKKLKPRTIGWHEESYHYFKNFLDSLGIKYVHEVTHSICVDYWEFMENKKLAEQTKITRSRSIRTQFNHYKEQKLIQENPWSGDSFKVLNKDVVTEVRSLEPKEMRVLLREIDTSTFVGFRLYVSLWMMFDNGIRIGELLKLNEWDIDFENCEILIKDPKNGQDRMAPISEETASLLKALIENNKKIPELSCSIYRNQR